MLVGNMVWQIGQRQMDVFEQICWIKDNGFAAVSFHTCDCLNGGEGLDPKISNYDLDRLKKALSGFEMVDIHAPFENFDINLASLNPLIRAASVACIKKSIVFAAKIKAATVTVHTGKMCKHLREKSVFAALAKSLRELEPEAEKADLLIGLEADTPQAYKFVKDLGLPHTGITLDTGHMSFEDGRGWRGLGSIGNVIREYHDKLVHMHFHDFDDGKDHLPPGSGTIDFREIIAALCEVNFAGSLCLELSPQYAAEQDIIKSKKLLDNLISETKKGAA